jgi:hypothetical protein
MKSKMKNYIYYKITGTLYRPKGQEANPNLIS